jgi:hypothetical protein
MERRFWTLLIEPLAHLKVRLSSGVVQCLEPGKLVDFPDEQARKLILRAKGRVRCAAIAGACSCCHSLKFWLSVNDRIVCGVCHPPANSSLVKEWLEVTK